MKKNRYSILFLFCCISFSMVSQNKSETKITTKSKVVTYSTSDLDWKNVDGRWYYKDSLTNNLPSHYIKNEENITIDSIDGILKSCQRQFTKTEFLITYKTTHRHWVWHGYKWYFNGNKTDYFPPEYICIKEENIDILESDCVEVEKKITISSSQRKEEEYFSILKSNWKWNEKQLKWVFKNQLVVDKSPSYLKTKTVSTVTTKIPDK